MWVRGCGADAGRDVRLQANKKSLDSKNGTLDVLMTESHAQRGATQQNIAQVHSGGSRDVKGHGTASKRVVAQKQQKRISA